MNTYENQTLPELWAAQQDLNAAIVAAVAAARQGGQSWSQIGAQLGITKQAAHERFGDKKS
jgi:predicted transcriptional regulator